MKKIIALFSAALICLTAASCASTDKTEVTTDAPTDDTIAEMTLEEKVGQLLFVRCPDAGYEDEILGLGVGGILMFGRDFKDLTADEVRQKINSYQGKSDIPLIIGVDEEGGTVVRVSSNPNLAENKFDSPRNIYAEGGMDAVIATEREKSELLLSLGINMNLAPVADTAGDADAFMYDRSFSGDYELTAEFVSKTVAVMKETGIKSVLKHFPGYGSVVEDTHEGTARSVKSADAMRAEDFLPFKAGIDAGCDCILISHNIADGFDSENPASLSPVIHDILRSELGFDGVIMTDDIAMGAVADIENVYVKAINAGNDMLITTDYKTAYDELLAAAQSGEISTERIDASVRRILKMKGYM